MVVPHRHPRIVVRYDADLPRIRVENGGKQKGNFVCNNAERRHCKDCSNYHCRIRAPFDLPSVHFTMIFSMASLRLSTG